VRAPAGWRPTRTTTSSSWTYQSCWWRMRGTSWWATARVAQGWRFVSWWAGRGRAGVGLVELGQRWILSRTQS